MRLSESMANDILETFRARLDPEAQMDPEAQPNPCSQRSR